MVCESEDTMRIVGVTQRHADNAHGIFTFANHFTLSISTVTNCSGYRFFYFLDRIDMILQD